MSAVRNLINDLVDRRLWPIAVALLVALVAVPVLLGGGSKAPASAPAAPLAATQASPAAQAAVSMATTPATTTPTYRPGPVRNPFAQHHVPAPATATTPATPTPSSSAPVSSGPSVPIGGSITPTPVLPGTGGVQPDTTVKDVWRVNVRFGEAGDQKLHRGIPRLTPLPSATNPFFIFMGVLADHKTAVFLISSDATPTGDGTCKPSKDQCETVEMRAGDTEFFDVTDGNAGVTQYELDLTKVFKSTVTGKAAAAKASRVSSDGKNVLHELKAEGQPIGYGRYIWSAKRGVLVRRHHLSAKVTASSASTGSTPGAQMSQVFGVTWTG